MADKYAAKGAVLVVDSNTIANYLGGTPSGGEAERIDVTTHDSVGGYREFRQGFKGEVTFSFGIVYDPNEATHEALAQLYEDGTVVNCTLTLPTTPSAVIAFSAFVSNFPIPAHPVDGRLELEVVLTVSGAITFPGVS